VGRAIVEAPVRRARRTNRIRIASTSDFVLGRAREYAREPGAETALPYCLDFVRRRTIYALGLDLKEAQEAPFYYLYARRAARRILSVPWEAGPIGASAPATSPVLLFSPGRCGSTLLSRILLEAGLANLSEPDFYAQMMSSLCAFRASPLRGTVKNVGANLTRDLASAFAPERAPVFKLRSECCRAPDLLLGQGATRTIFMTRDFEPWARSTLRHFSGGPSRAVAKYLRAMRCYDFLRKNTDCHLLHYEELVRDPVTTCDRLGRFLGKTIPREAVAAAMNRDSQAGTPLARDARKERQGWEAILDQTLQLWGSRRATPQRRQLPLYDS
jgi:hypothetical protein